jgi:hypothetical protein
MTDTNTNAGQTEDMATAETAVGLPGSNVEAAAFSYLPCRPGGPSREDTALAARIGPRLHGALRGNMTPGRVCCARRVVEATEARNLPRRAAVIAVTTTIVESTILNVTGGDRDSVGLFQQRATWGTRAQRLDPKWATDAFLNAMLQAYPNWSWLTAPIGEVCQKVQRSAFPARYQPQAPDAAIIVYALAPTSAVLAFGDTGPEIVDLQKQLARALKRALGADGVFGPATREAVIEFQRREKLEADGVAGPKTRAALRKAAAPAEAASVTALPDQAGGPEADQAAADGDGSEGRGAVEAPAGGVAGASGVRINPGVKIGSVGALLVRILAHYPRKAELYVTSGYRPNGPGQHSHHGGLVYKGSPTAAIDFAADGGTGEAGLVRMRDAAKWFYDKLADLTVELIHSTPFKDDQGFYVKNQVKYPGGGPYDAATRRQHLDHVHFATSKALAEQILARLEKK